MKNGNLSEDNRHSLKGPTKVLIVDLARSYGGVEKRIEQLVKRLHERNLSYGIMVLGNSRIHQWCKSGRRKIYPLYFARGNPLILVFIVYIILTRKFHIIDAHNVQSQFWGGLAAVITRKKMVCTVHSSYGKIYKGFRKWFYERVLKFNASLGAHFIAVSGSVVETLTDLGIDMNRIDLIYNGIDARRKKRFRQTGKLSEISCKESSLVIVSIGRLEPEKGHRYLLRAIKYIRDKKPEHENLRCFILGDGRLKNALIHETKDLKIEDKVFFPGFVANVEEYLCNADIFCLPSLTEGLPFALLEACRFEIAPLLTRVGDMGRLFKHNTHAYLVSPGDFKALARGILALWKNTEKRLEMGRNAFKLVQERLSDKRMVEETILLYQRVIS